MTNGFIGFSARNIITENVEESAITKNEDGFVFYNNDNKSLLISYEGDLEEITLPDTHEYEIYGFAFLGCKKLTAVTIGDNVKRIGILAFYKCENLSSVIIGNGVETISYSAFKNCTSLKTLALGTGLKNIYRGAFDICDGIESILFTGPFSQFKNIAIAEEGNDIFTTAKITYNAKLEPPVEE